MEAPVGTPVIEKQAKDLMVSEMVQINGVTCQIIAVMPYIEGMPFITISVKADGLREWEQVMLNVPADQVVSVALPYCSPIAIAQTQAVKQAIAQQEAMAQAQAQAPVAQAPVQAPAEQQQRKPVGPVQYMEYNSGYCGYL